MNIELKDSASQGGKKKRTMVIYRFSDRLSRCDPSLYSNIYDVRKWPNAKHPSSILPPLHKNEVEISRNKLKKDALSYLKRTFKSNIKQSDLIRFGKHLFLAITFPPYFIIYGLPKQILTKGLLVIFFACKSVQRKIQEQMQIFIASLTYKTVQIIQLIKNLISILIFPIFYSALKIRQTIISYIRENNWKNLKNPVREARIILNQLPLTLIKKIFVYQQRLLQIKEKGNQQLKKYLSQIKEKGNQQLKKNFVGIKEVFKERNKKLKLVVKWGKIQFYSLNQKVICWNSHYKTQFFATRQLAQQTTHQFVEEFKNRIKNLKSYFASVNFYWSRLKLQEKKLSKQYQIIYLHMRGSFYQKYQLIFSFLKIKGEKLRFLYIKSFFQNSVFYTRLNMFSQLLRYCLKKFFPHPISSIFHKKVIKTYLFFIKIIPQILHYKLKLLFYGINIAKQTYNSIQKHVKLIGKKVLNFLMSKLRIFKKGALYLLYYFFLYITIIFILCVWGIRYLEKCTKFLISNFLLGTR